MRALIYLRVSTDKQAEKGLSIPAQREHCLSYAEKLKYEVTEDEIFIDAGESARTTDRPEFQRLLDRCEKDSTIKAVIMYDISRFSRNGVEYFIVKERLEKLGIGIHSVSEPLEPLDKTGSPATWLMEWILAGFAEFRSRQDAQKIFEGMKRKAQDGVYPARAPFGYKNMREVISGEKNRAWIEVDEKEAPWVEKVFMYYATNDYSYGELADKLFKEGFPTRTNKKLHKSSVETILKNKFYAGVIEWGGIIADGSHKPIIDKVLFDKVQVIREVRNLGADRTRKHIFALRGIANCAECGSRWTAGYHKGRSGKKYGFYSCQKAQKGQRVLCSQGSISIDYLEADFARVFKQVQLPNAVVEKIRKKVRAIFAKEEEVYEKMRAAYLAEETKLKSQQSRLIKLYMNGGISDEQYEQEKSNLEALEMRNKASAERVDSELKNVVRMVEIAVGLANNCYRAYKKAPYELKTLLAHAFFNKIVIKDGQIVSAKLNPPLDYFCAKRLQASPVFQLAYTSGPGRT